MFVTPHRVMSNAGDTLKLRFAAYGHGADMNREGSFAAFGPDASPFEIRRRRWPGPFALNVDMANDG